MLAYLFAFLAPSAHAADCAAPYSVDALLGDLTGTETGLRENDPAGAGTAAKRLRDGLGCMDELLPAMIASRAYRAVGAGLHAAGEAADGDKWFRTALELDPTWVYGVNELSEDSPIRRAFDQLKLEEATDAELIEGKGFPEEQKQFLDGRKLSSPKARLDRYHVFQVDGAPVKTAVIEGNAFPGPALTDASAPEEVEAPKVDKKAEKAARKAREAEEKAKQTKTAGKEKKPKKAKGPKTKVGPNGEIIYKRQRPAEKTPLMIIGGVILAGAGGVYALALQSSNKFDSIKTAADVNETPPPTDAPFRLCGQGQDPATDGCFADPVIEAGRVRGATNRLVLASGLTAVVGAGVFTWGAIVDGDRIVPTVTFRW